MPKTTKQTENPLFDRSLGTCKTLEDRLKGAVPRNQAQETLINLGAHKEKELVAWITTLTQHGYAPWASICHCM
jgi:hypothetical protein